jgi:D-arabinose 1-dehydrogenase-like Zn-dependent alcohol dehydrogenase
LLKLQPIANLRTLMLMCAGLTVFSALRHVGFQPGDRVALAGLAGYGTLVLLAVGPGDVSLNPMALVIGRRRVMGSPAGSRKDLRDTLAFAAEQVCGRA